MYFPSSEERDGVRRRGGGQGRGGVGVGWVRGNRRVEKTGVTEEGEPVTMACVSSSVSVRERCWISSRPLLPTRSVQKLWGRGAKHVAFKFSF